MMFVSLHEGKIHIRPDGVRRSTAFRHTDVEKIGNFLAKHNDLDFMCSSSLNHPHECGFRRDFNADVPMRKAVHHALRKLAIHIKGVTPESAASSIEKAIKKANRKAPFAVVIDNRPEMIVFHDPDTVEWFLIGLRLGTSIGRTK